MIQPLAVADQSQSTTNLSRLISLSILDQDGNEISIRTNPFEIIIPRDPNVHIPPRSITPGRKRPFVIVFDSFHSGRITVVFCRTVHG